jgi:hypothetical protein
MLSVTTGGGDANNVVSPLFDAPPQPRGWLTEEERIVIELFSHDSANLAEHFPYMPQFKVRADILAAILARSTPPEVVLPFVDPALARMVYGRDSEWLAALAAAGVAVKEVGRE